MGRTGLHDRFDFRRVMGPGERILLGCTAALPLLAPFELLMRQRDPFHPAMLPAWLISAVAVALSVTLGAGAVMGVGETTTFDRGTRSLIHTAAGAFGFRRRQVFPFHAVAVSARFDDDTDTCWRWRVEASVPGRRSPLLLERFDEPRRAEDLARRLRDLIGGREA